MKRNRRLFKFLLSVLVAILLWVGLSPFLATYLIKEKHLDHADAIMVLSGSSTYLERNQEAAALYRQGVAPKIFLTDDGLQGGWNKKEQRNPYFVEKARIELNNQGVPDEDIEVLPGTVHGTNDEADALVKAAGEKGLKSVLLVTSAYHSRRTLFTFERAAGRADLGLEIGMECPPTGQQTPPPFAWWLTKNGWMFVGEEYLKIVYYWFFH